MVFLLFVLNNPRRDESACHGHRASEKEEIGGRPLGGTGILLSVEDRPWDAIRRTIRELFNYTKRKKKDRDDSEKPETRLAETRSVGYGACLRHEAPWKDLLDLQEAFMALKSNVQGWRGVRHVTVQERGLL
jgi:hypothetical protein